MTAQSTTAASHSLVSSSRTVTSHSSAAAARDTRPSFAIQWHITDSCDQRCKHCYLFSEDAAMPCFSMPLEQMMDVLDQAYELCDSLGRQPYFYITGGDPILHPQFWELATELHKRSSMWCMMGNPFHINEQSAARLKALGCRKYQLSLDGLEKTHDHFRKPGSFADTLRAARVLKDAGIWVAIMSTVSSTNADEFPELIRLVDRMGVDVFAFGRYCPTKGQQLDEFHMEPEEYRAFLLKCQQAIDECKANGSTVTWQKKDHLWKLLDWEQGRLSIAPTCEDGSKDASVHEGCHCGTGHLTVLPNGDVYACRRMDSKVGNVREACLSEIFRSATLAEFRQIDRFTKCANCELRGWCRGCPAVTFGYTGNMYDPDPQCWKEVA